MARKPLPLGSHGNIRMMGQTAEGWKPKTQIPKGARLTRWRAIANYRGHDGRTRPIQRDGSSITDATNRLREHVTELNATRASLAGSIAATDEPSSAVSTSIDRYLRVLRTEYPQLLSGAPLTATSRVIEAVPAYFSRIREECTPHTCDRYVSALRAHVIPGIGLYLLTECTVPRLGEFEAGLVSKRGTKPRPGRKPTPPSKLTPKTRSLVREVIRGLMQVAVEAGVLDHNPVKSMRRIKGGAQRPAKAIPAADVPTFFAAIDADERAVVADLPTIIRTLFGFGCRIGEAMALTWRYINLGDEPIERTAFAGTPDETTRTLPACSVWLNATITEAVGHGIQRTPTKTTRSNRVIAIPAFLHLQLMLRKTGDVSEDDPVFPNPGPRPWRSPNGVQQAIVALRGRIGMPDFKSHAGRKTAATVLYANGLQHGLADQFGHISDDFTRSNYVTPGPANPEAAVILDRVLSGTTE